jgi:hypothetical protein
MQLHLTLLGAPTALGFFLCQGAIGAPSSAVVQLPLTIIRAHLYVPVALAGQTKPHWWLVDTGSPWSVVNIDHATQLVRSVSGTQEKSTTVAGRACRVLVNIGTIVDGYHLGYFDFFEAPLSGMIGVTLATGRPDSDQFEVGGILGVNFLAKHGALLNFHSQRLSLHAAIASATGRAGLEKIGYTYVPIQVTAVGRIEVVGSVGAKTYSFLIDSGSPKTILQSTIKGADWLFGGRGDRVYFAQGQSSQATSGRLSGFKLGAQDVSATVVLFAKLPNLQTGFSYPMGGLIGEDFLWGYQAILDMGGHALYLKPAS